MAICRTRSVSEPSMSEPFIDETGTAPGFSSLVPLLSNSFMHTWECDYEENLPRITQNPENGIEWTLEWFTK